MYVERIKKKQGGKTYEQVLIRESYREQVGDESRVRHRTVLNITSFPRETQDAIAAALKQPERVLEGLAQMAQGEPKLQEGRSVGAVWCVFQVAARVGIVKALGRGRQAQLALWQVVARVIDQGSRLSAVRLHETHALADIIAPERGFDEDDLYENLAWLAEEQERIESHLFKTRSGGQPPALFLYDVTSTYLEGDQNAFGAFGYNRDAKRGKKQLVIGMLCDDTGEPVSVEVFQGNTQDPKTLAPQIRKTAERFGCSEVTFVGDRGMIKRAQMDALNEAGFHYITALTKPQIEKLIKEGTLQMGLFDELLCEVQYGHQRLVLRRNPARAAEVAESRQSKYEAAARYVVEQNSYLAHHPKASVSKAAQRVEHKLNRLYISSWLRVVAEERTLRLETDEEALNERARLDGCYVLITDVQPDVADTETVHARYKDLAEVERGFRTSKTGHLELRPVYVRNEASTRGHVFVVMLAYLIRRELERAWRPLDVTIEEGLETLKTLCSMTVQIGNEEPVQKIPEPRELSRRLLDALDMQLPPVLPKKEIRIATKTKLPKNRATT